VQPVRRLILRVIAEYFAFSTVSDGTDRENLAHPADEYESVTASADAHVSSQTFRCRLRGGTLRLPITMI